MVWSDPAGNVIPGGHRRQLDETAKHLRLLGIDVDVSYDPDADIASYDLVHGLALSLAQMRRCRQSGVPVALSTIYWERWYLAGQYKDGRPISQMFARFRSGASLWLAAVRGRGIDRCGAVVQRFTDSRVLFEMADMLLPNSVGEGAAIVRDLGVTTPQHVVPNAVDPERFKDVSGTGHRDYVLFVGRFEPHKNQMGFISAMRRSNLPVVMAGVTHPDHPRYRDECRRRASANIKILGVVSDDELAKLYAGAKVHVLPSWYETTGLTSLEAALGGCNVVTTSRGFAKEYFEDMAWYCDPSDGNSIRNAVKAAYEAPQRSGLREKILRNYTWHHTARATLAAYEKVLNSRKEAVVH
jgi:glycosyltransferase involved in cell wall biosynthesis